VTVSGLRQLVRRVLGVAVPVAALVRAGRADPLSPHGLALAFAGAMVIFALGECLLSPTMPAIINDLAPPQAAGRYNGLGALAFTTGFLLGPAIGGAAGAI
jgi:MFS family permease